MKVINDMIAFDQNGKLELIVDPKSREQESIKYFNDHRRIFRYLVQTGMLKRVAKFYEERKMNDGATVICFVVNSDELRQFDDEVRNNVPNIGITNAYFDPDQVRNGEYDGCISIASPMRTYRNNHGVVSRGWETGAVERLNTQTCNRVAGVYRKYGAERAGEFACKLLLGLAK